MPIWAGLSKSLRSATFVLVSLLGDMSLSAESVANYWPRGRILTRSALHCLRIVLTLLIFCELTLADTPAPQFNLRSLDGQTFSNASLSGDIVLLEFWATWCGYCKKD